MHAYINACLHCTYTSIQTNKLSRIHTCRPVHVQMHTLMHTYIQKRVHTNAHFNVHKPPQTATERICMMHPS